MDKEDNLKIVYKESVETYKYQQSAVDLIYNKLNWILVSDIVFLAALYGAHRHSAIVALLVVLSAILSLLGLNPRKFKGTAKISEQLKKVDSDKNKFLEAIISKRIEAFNANEKRINDISCFLSFSKWLLISALIIQFLLLFIH